jgi:Xaa-Pro aminopeptidase
MEPLRPFIPETEILNRLFRLQGKVCNAGLDGALVFEYVELLYYTGTLQNGTLFVPPQGDPLFFVRRSLERARMESPLKEIIPYTSFKDIIAVLGKKGCPLGKIGIDENAVTLSHFKLLKKNFSTTEFSDIGLALRKVRAVKSAYEISKIRQAGDVGKQVTAKVPALLKPGITEWELALKLYNMSAMLGRTCLGRLAFNSGEFSMGVICFGDSSNYPVAFDGPGGIQGITPACPYGGGERRLKKGDLVFIDIAFPFEEYYVDKTRIFSLGRPDPLAVEAHSVCLKVQELVRRRLAPGTIPSAIYDKVYREIIEPFKFDDNFMGYKSNKVKFLGHGIGMVINEYPVIAKKFDEPLEENMVMAVEPKKGLEGLGMVGIENTFQVTPQGGLNLTADNDEIVVV